MLRRWLALCLCSAASPVYAVSLTGYYKLDDASPTTTTTTATATIGANGTYVGGFGVGNFGQSGSPGDPTGNSVLFQTSGTLNRRIDIPNGGGASGTNMTISMWVKFDAAALDRDVALANNSNTFGVSNVNIFRDDANSGNGANTNMIAAILGGDPRATSATNSANDTNWHLVSVAYRTSGAPDSTQIFIDGVRSSFQTANNTSATGVTNATIALGNILGTHANQMGGLMDEVGFWDRALTSPEMQALYFLNTNTAVKFDAAGVATLLDFYEDGDDGDTLSLNGTQFLIVPDVTAFSGLAGQSALVNNQLVLGLDVSGNGGLISLAVPEPASAAVWLTLLGVAVAVGLRRRRR